MPIISALPSTLQNGLIADATQVMADMTQIVNNVNLNAAENGANSTITSLSGLTTPLSVGQGGTASATASGARTNLGLDALVVPTGTIIDYIGTTAPTGYVLAAGKTIGDASSGGTERANADTVTLFTLLWNSWADAQAPVSTGRGASAAADYAAHKTITVPDLRGRSTFGIDNLGGSAANRVTVGNSGIAGTTPGAVGGSELLHTHTHTASVTDPTHAHTGSVNTESAAVGANNVAMGPNGVEATKPVTINAAATGISVTNANAGTGSSQNMTPAMMVTKAIKL